MEIELTKVTGGYKLIIADNGMGFDYKKVNFKKSFGLTGIKERASVLDGEVTIKSEIGKGTMITVVF